MKMNELIQPYSAILFFLFICCKTEKKDNSKCITSTSELESIEPTLNYYKGDPSTDSLWINTLDKLEEPSFMRQGDYINVYFSDFPFIGASGKCPAFLFYFCRKVTGKIRPGE